MASYTLTELREQVRDLLRDNSNTGLDLPMADDANSYSNAQITDAINWAIRDFCQQTKSSFIEHTSLTVDVNGLATIPTDFITIDDVKYAAKSLIKSSAEFEDMKNPEWEDATGTVCKRWVPWSGNQIKFTPIAWTASTVAAMGYIQSPTPLVNDSDLVDSRIPEYEQGYLKYGAAWYLLQFCNDKQNQDLAGKYLKQYRTLISPSRS